MLFVRKLSLEDDDLDTVIGLLHESKIHKLPFEFFDVDDASRMIKKLMGIKGNEYSAENFWVCFEDGKIVGTVQMYDPMKIELKEALGIYYNVSKNRKHLKRYRNWRIFSKPLQHKGSTLYVHNAGYADGYRLEVSSLFIETLCDYAKESNYVNVHTDIISSETKIIDFLKAKEFKPIRIMYDDDCDCRFLRLSRSI